MPWVTHDIGASAVNGFHRIFLHHRLNSSRLVVLLQKWAREDGERTEQPQAQQRMKPDVAEQLSQWMGTVDAVKLSRALHAMESLPHHVDTVGLRGLPCDVQALERLVEKTKTDLTGLAIAKLAAPKPARARADNTLVKAPDPQIEADFGAHGRRYLDLQKQMDMRLSALRAHLRHTLAKGSCALQQLAALDAVMEQMLGEREHRLWASLAVHLERRFAYRHLRHQQTLQAIGLADDPLRWRQPGGWLGAFEHDLQALLMAEIQVRFQPIAGLLEAALHEKTGQQE